jgi:hypothetical protein
VRGDWHLVFPAAVHHDLTAEVKLKEELVDQPVHTRVAEDLQSDRNLNLGSVHIEFEAHKVLRGGQLLDETSRRVVRGEVCRDGCVEEVIQAHVAQRDVCPKVFGLEQGVLPAEDMIQHEAELKNTGEAEREGQRGREAGRQRGREAGRQRGRETDEKERGR